MFDPLSQTQDDIRVVNLKQKIDTLKIGISFLVFKNGYMHCVLQLRGMH